MVIIAPIMVTITTPLITIIITTLIFVIYSRNLLLGNKKYLDKKRRNNK